MLLLVVAPLALAQPTPTATPDSLRLGPLRRAASAHDPRAAQADLLARAAALRRASLRAEALPQWAVTGQAAYQSDALALPVRLPDGSSPTAPHLHTRLQADADWNVYDGGRRAQRAALDEARLAEDRAALDASLAPLRDAATDAFFALALLDVQARTLALTRDDLAARLAVAQARAAQGVALHTDAAALEAELIRARQRLDEAESQRAATRAVLAALVGQPLAPDAPLALPSLDAATAALADGAMERPELKRLERTAARAAAEGRLSARATRPAVYVFGQAGVGRPSPYNPLDDTVQPYGLAGVRLRWTPYDYGSAARGQQLADLAAATARTEADAFRARVQRETEGHRAALRRLDAQGDDDLRAIVLREEVLRVVRRRLEEGVALVPEYVDALTDLEDARLVQARHRVERVQAQARLLALLGRYPDTL